MKVQTDLRAGVTADEARQGVQTSLANARNAVSSAAQGIAQQTQAFLDNPSVREMMDKLKGWPFGQTQA
jgi:hypothetical protein